MKNEENLFFQSLAKVVTVHKQLAGDAHGLQLFLFRLVWFRPEAFIVTHHDVQLTILDLVNSLDFHASEAIQADLAHELATVGCRLSCGWRIM